VSRPRVVIVGGGFAGLNAAKELRNADVDITIVDRRNFHLFQPLLYQVASAALNPSDIAYPIRSVFRSQDNVRNVVLGEVTSVDVEGGTVALDDGSEIGFEYLMVATGATHSYFGNDSWAADAPGLKTIEDALDIRGRILRAFEEAERHPERADEFLTFVIVGAGPTGVEMAGSVAEIAVHALGSDFRHIDPASARVVLVEGSSHVLPVYPESLSSRAQRQLEELGVEVRTDALVVGIDGEGVTLASGERLAARTVVWAAGVRASSLGAALPGDRDRAGRVLVAPDLSLPGYSNVFVAGDLAAVTVDGAPVPGVAPAAMQQGRHVARQVLADLAGAPRSDFRYRDKGSLATIGRARAVADFGRLRFGGAFAWLAWLAIHIVYLIGFRNRVFVVFQWAWHYATFRRGARIITDAVRRGRG
jgi:NADH dehydrogenase